VSEHSVFAGPGGVTPVGGTRGDRGSECQDHRRTFGKPRRDEIRVALEDSSDHPAVKSDVSTSAASHYDRTPGMRDFLRSSASASVDKTSRCTSIRQGPRAKTYRMLTRRNDCVAGVDVVIGLSRPTAHGAENEAKLATRDHPAERRSSIAA